MRRDGREPILFEGENELIDAGIANKLYPIFGAYYEVNDGQISYAGVDKNA